MAEINVLFPEQGEPHVSAPTEVVHASERITWNFFSAREDIDAVRIRFDGAANKFFNGAATEWDKALDIHGRGHMWADAPEFTEKDRPQFARYSILGLKGGAGGQVVAELDPIIVVDKP